MREFFREIVHALEEGRPVELVSIAASDGSTPRGAGAMMAVFPGGGIAGTIGGGNVEFECQRLAAELLERGGDALRQFRFALGDAASLGMVCGGGVTVQFQYLPAGEQRIIAVLRDLIEADGGNRDTWLLRRIEGERVTAMGLADRTGPRHLDAPPEDLELLCGNQVSFFRAKQIACYTPRLDRIADDQRRHKCRIGCNGYMCSGRDQPAKPFHIPFILHGVQTIRQNKHPRLVCKMCFNR